MPVSYKLGKKPAVVDNRVKRLSVAVPRLPTPPNDVNWYAAIGSWGMLSNDSIGDCVEAAVLHCIEQFSAYAGDPVEPTDQEALTFYEKAAGYDPSNPDTDLGSYVLGPNGVMQYWAETGVTCGGKLNKVSKFLQIKHKNPIEWMQGVWLFGGLMCGLNIPESLMQSETLPYCWQDFSGPIAGGHEVWINGYETLNSGRVYDLVSWGGRYRATEAFLLNCVDEMVVVIDPAEFNTRGVNASGMSLAQLVSDEAML